MIKRSYIDIVTIACLLLFVQCASHAKLSDDIEALKQQLKAVHPPTQSALAQQIQKVNAATQNDLEHKIQKASATAQSFKEELQKVKEGMEQSLVQFYTLTVEVQKALKVMCDERADKFIFSGEEGDTKELESIGNLQSCIHKIGGIPYFLERATRGFFNFDVMGAALGQHRPPPGEISVSTATAAAATTSSSTPNSTPLSPLGNE